MPRGHDVEQQVVVELAAGRAMGALHVVGEDLEFRLVVHGRAVGEQQRLGSSCAPSVFCAACATMILPWNTPVASPSSDVLEHLAAVAVGRDVVDDQRRVGVLAAARQRRAADRRVRVLAREAQKHLMARQRRRPVSENVSNVRCAPTSTPSVEMHRRFLARPFMRTWCALAPRRDRTRPAPVARCAAPGALVALDQRERRAGAERHDDVRGGRGGERRLRNARCSAPASGVGLDVDHHRLARKGARQRQRCVGSSITGEAHACGQCVERSMLDACRQAPVRRPAMPSTNMSVAARSPSETSRSGSADSAGSPGGRRAARLQQRAQVRVMPGLDAAVRQALVGEARERGLAARARRPHARQRLEALGETRLDGRGWRFDARVHCPHAASAT